jgi:hypothetical protein
MVRWQDSRGCLGRDWSKGVGLRYYGKDIASVLLYLQ